MRILWDFSGLSPGPTVTQEPLHMKEGSRSLCQQEAMWEAWLVTALREESATPRNAAPGSLKAKKRCSPRTSRKNTACQVLGEPVMTHCGLLPHNLWLTQQKELVCRNHGQGQKGGEWSCLVISAVCHAKEFGFHPIGDKPWETGKGFSKMPWTDSLPDLPSKKKSHAELNPSFVGQLDKTWRTGVSDRRKSAASRRLFKSALQADRKWHLFACVKLIASKKRSQVFREGPRKPRYGTTSCLLVILSQAAALPAAHRALQSRESSSLTPLTCEKCGVTWANSGQLSVLRVYWARKLPVHWQCLPWALIPPGLVGSSLFTFCT